MIRGVVSQAAVAIVELIFDGPDGSDVAVAVGVDTGFDGDLLLPAEVIQQLQLQKLGTRDATLADGTTVRYENYVAIVVWDDVPKVASVLESTGAALIGMNLMQSCRLTIDVLPGGEVTISKLP